MPIAKKLPSGSYRVQVFDYQDSGKKKHYKSFTAPTKAEAEFMAANYIQNKNIYSEPLKMTLYDAYTRYIESKSNVLSPSTIREYKRSQEKDLKDLMYLKLSNLTQEKVQIAINKESIAHSPKSVRNMHGLLSAVLSLFYPSFQLHTQLPQKDIPALTIPEEDQVKKILQAVKGKSLEIPILLAACGPLRRSEICALRYDDIKDLGAYVDKAMVKDENGKWVIKKPKTPGSERLVPLPKEVIDVIESKRGHKSGASRISTMLPGTISDRFRELIVSLFGEDTHIRFHDLRHYCASFLHALGVPDMYIMARGGWQSRETLNRVYTHALEKQKEEFNKDINSKISSSLFAGK